MFSFFLHIHKSYIEVRSTFILEQPLKESFFFLELKDFQYEILE
jgi:hypothetical protein